ncbi:MAG: VWA domain-containing protein, partial [Myxococcota bacterium]|nr:VWA domain-containing protein [Myxococcota bacterium]
MQLAEPHWMIVGALVSALILALAALDARRRRRAVERFASPTLQEALTGTVARRRRALKLACVVLGTLAAFVALARPQWGWRWEQTERRGTDILFAVDTSKSMLAEDLRPNRLERAKLAVSDLVAQFDGDRAGLVAFAGEAFLQSPMTMDRDAFARALRELDTEIIPRGGTDVGAALREAQAAFGETDSEKILVLLTDGESLEGDAVQAAEDAAAAGVRVFAVGLGGADGSVVPVRGSDGETTLLRDPETGELVRSRLDESTLRRIAEVTGGDYQPLGQDGRGLTRLWRDHLAELPAHAVASRRHRVFTERFQWPLGLAIGLLLLEPLIGERRRRRARRPQAASGTRPPRG